MSFTHKDKYSSSWLISAGFYSAFVLLVIHCDKSGACVSEQIKEDVGINNVPFNQFITFVAGVILQFFTQTRLTEFLDKGQ